MKRYILSVAAFLLIAGVAGAQATKKASTDKPAVTTTKPAGTTTPKKPSVSKPVTTTTTTAATNKTTSSTAPIKRKNHSKVKSVPASK
jgi:hypothetical protein